MAEEGEKQILTEKLAEEPKEKKKTKEKSSAAVLIALVLLLLLIIALCVIGWMAYGIDTKSKHLDGHHELYRQNEEIYNNLVNESEHKEKEFNETVAELEEKERKQNETIELLADQIETLINGTDDELRALCDKPEVAAALTSGTGSTSGEPMIIICFLLNLYLLLCLQNYPAVKLKDS